MNSHSKTIFIVFFITLLFTGCGSDNNDQGNVTGGEQTATWAFPLDQSLKVDNSDSLTGMWLMTSESTGELRVSNEHTDAEVATGNSVSRNKTLVFLKENDDGTLAYYPDIAGSPIIFQRNGNVAEFSDSQEDANVSFKMLFTGNNEVRIESTSDGSGILSNFDGFNEVEAYRLSGAGRGIKIANTETPVAFSDANLSVNYMKFGLTEIADRRYPIHLFSITEDKRSLAGKTAEGLKKAVNETVSSVNLVAKHNDGSSLDLWDETENKNSCVTLQSGEVSCNDQKFLDIEVGHFDADRQYSFSSFWHYFPLENNITGHTTIDDYHLDSVIHAVSPIDGDNIEYQYGFSH